VVAQARCSDEPSYPTRPLAVSPTLDCIVRFRILLRRHGNVAIDGRAIWLVSPRDE